VADFVNAMIVAIDFLAHSDPFRSADQVRAKLLAAHLAIEANTPKSGLVISTYSLISHLSLQNPSHILPLLLEVASGIWYRADAVLHRIPTVAILVV